MGTVGVSGDDEMDSTCVMRGDYPGTGTYVPVVGLMVRTNTGSGIDWHSHLSHSYDYNYIPVPGTRVGTYR